MDGDKERSKRRVAGLTMKRSVIVSKIRAIYALSQRTNPDPGLIERIVIGVRSLDELLTQFDIEDTAILDILTDIGELNDYSPELPVQVLDMANTAQACANMLRPPVLNHGLKSDKEFLPSKLPVIPLPQFSGDVHQWTTFRDRFNALVDNRPNVSNIDKMYYLIGCLHGPALDEIRTIPAAADNYDLAWTTLAARFDRPRVVATSLIDRMVNAPVSHQETLQDLNKFIKTFEECTALLSSQNIPDLGSFILFSLAFRCLPVNTRKLFESRIPAVYPSLSDLLSFSRARIAVLENAGETGATSGPTKSHSSVSRNRGSITGTSTASLITSNAPVTPVGGCACSTGGHPLTSCSEFQSWSVDARQKWARDHRRCFVCLSDKHWSNRCLSTERCASCSKKHHTLLHGAQGVQSAHNTAPVVDVLCADVPSERHNPPSSTCVLLGTALVHVPDRFGTVHTVRALLDSASQISAITTSCAQRLGFRPTPWTMPVSGMAGTPVVDVKGVVTCQVQPRFSPNPILSVNAWVFPRITSDMPRHSFSNDVKTRFDNFALADPSFHVSSPVDMLLGADLYPAIMDGRREIIDVSLPSAFNTIFGWVLIGPMGQHHADQSHAFPVSLTTSIETLLDKFWHIEEPDDAPLAFTGDGQCEQIFTNECTRLSSGRFVVPLPFQQPSRLLNFPGSRAMALKRFNTLERKLQSDVKLHRMYTDFMSDYLALGHMSVATSPGQYFIPHHAVFRPDERESKVRVVFDASARCPGGSSLNDRLLQGPKLQQDIVNILTRFRIAQFAFTADICKMYRQILILPTYRKYQHILWRSSPTDQLVEYELNTVTYGMNCAPFLALRTLQMIAETDCDEADKVRDALTSQTYVDDICTGADSELETLALQCQLINVMKKSGLELKKWSSNLSKVLDAVPSNHRMNGSLPVNVADDGCTKVLGVQWQSSGDFFGCVLHCDSAPVFTKRGLLSVIARIFDPLGLFAPTIFRAKCIMQRTWSLKLSWDDPLPDDIRTEWSTFVSDLPALSNVRVPRHINSHQGSPCQLLGFCDASQSGYAAVVYIRILDVPRESSVFLLGAKTKLAPLKPLSIPRLELNGALLLSRWMDKLRNCLGSQLNIVETFAWTDSTIVLSWLTMTHDLFKVYVSNRVHQIVSRLPSCQWLHVRSEQNPADCVSRGVAPSDMTNLDLYWKGPDFLRADSVTWDKKPPPLPLQELPETCPGPAVVHIITDVREWFHIFSSYDRAVRVVARIIRFSNNCRRIGSCHIRSEYLSRQELDNAIQVLVIESQRCHFSGLRKELVAGRNLSSKPISRLRPFIDSNDVIRVGGRLRHSSLSFQEKHPILLAKRSHLALLIGRHWHKITCHAGPRTMSVLIHRQFWIMSIRSVLFDVCHNCTVCVRLDSRSSRPLMADLPAARVQECRPFSRVGVDFAGPLHMKETSLRKSRTYKVYIAVFVCFAVKAVHLEVVTALSTDAFLAAFDRFVARRGLPTDIYSDCGTNFVGADTHLSKTINSSQGQAALGNSRSMCSWHFNPPSAPHFGGLWEAAVRSTKRLLIRVMGNHMFSYEEFNTIVSRVEAILNSRPLTPVSTDPDDLDFLSPGHFLIGQPLLAVPPRSTYTAKMTVTNRWKLLDQCHQAFWKRWSSEYLTTLQERIKWIAEGPNLRVDDMVVVMDGQSSPLAWRLGRVRQVLPGPDGIVRVARVFTLQGDIIRPVVKLVQLPTR